VGELAGVALRHVADAPRDRLPGVGAEGPALQPDLAFLRLEEAEQGAKERRLAAAVRAEHAHHLAVGEAEGHFAPHGAPGKAEPEALDGEHHHVRLATAKSQRKNGVPISAVSTPGGISMLAAVRPSVSTASMKAAPIS